MKKKANGLPLLSLPPCKHCGQREARRARGLCQACYYTPAAREQYPADRRNQFGLFKPNKILPKEGFDYIATDCPPGSEDKIEAMRARAERGLPTCHPNDAGYRERIIPPIRRRLRFAPLQ